MLSFDALKRWEDLGQFLEKAIIAYLDACHDLETALPNHSTRTSELLSRVEQRIAIFPTIISGPLASVQASIKRIRNSLASPVHRLPNEILARIFYISMYSVDVTDPLQVSRKHSATFIYRRLHVLAGVCSAWRRIGLQGYFWSLIPIVAKPNHEYGDEYTVAAARLSLQRAANLPLHLVTCIDSCATSAETARNFILETVSLHGPQLSTVDVSDSSTGFFVSFLNVLLGSITSKQSTIHQLSLRCFQSFGLTPSLINDTGSPLPPAFHHLMNSLERLRIFRLRIPFRDISFGKLVEIRLQDIRLDSELAISQFLQALTTSPQLRTLSMISIHTGRTFEYDFSPEDPPCILPSLQKLYLEDLPIHVLRYLLGSIAPGLYSVTLNWSLQCREFMASAEHIGIPLLNITSFVSGLSGFKIDTLVLWFGMNETRADRVIHLILKAMPTITTLHLDSAVLDSNLLRGLIPTAEGLEDYQELRSESPAFPQLKNLYISRSHCHEPTPLRDLPRVIASHPLQELGVGVGIDEGCYTCNHNLSLTIPSQSKINSEIESVRNLVPRLVRLPRERSDMVDADWFETRIWQRW